MSLFESVRLALRALAANKLRTALTMLGIIIGVGAVIGLMSIGQGAQAQVASQIQSMGTNLLFVRGGVMTTGGVRGGAGQATTLTLDDAREIATLPSVVAAAPESGGSGQLVAGGQNWNTRILGVTEDYGHVRNVSVAFGEWIQRPHVDGRSSVAVLGHTVASELFAGTDPIGRTVRVSMFGGTGVNFRVIGVTEEQGGGALGSQDDMMFVPISTMHTRLFAERTVRGQANVSTINVQVLDARLVDETVAEIGELLRTRHRLVEDAFSIQSQQEILSAFNEIIGIFTVFLGAIAGISLLVGGIGIMNIMLVSVTERTREIGIRKAVGARRRDILAQFLVESIVVSLLGGLTGVLLGAGIGALVGSLQIPAGGAGQHLQPQLNVEIVLLAFGVSAAVGLFFGVYPATRASRLRPIEALRYE